MSDTSIQDSCFEPDTRVSGGRVRSTHWSFPVDTAMYCSRPVSDTEFQCLGSWLGVRRNRIEGKSKPLRAKLLEQRTALEEGLPCTNFPIHRSLLEWCTGLGQSEGVNYLAPVFTSLPSVRAGGRDLEPWFRVY